MGRMFRTSELLELSGYIAEALKEDVIAAVRDILSSRREIIMPEDVAALFHITTAAVHKRCQRGQLPWHKDATGHYYFIREEIEKHLSIETKYCDHL